MKKFSLLILAMVIFAAAGFLFFFDHHGHDHNHGRHDGHNHGDDEHREDDVNVELSEAAIDNYGIRTRSIAPGATITLPHEAVVASRDEYFVYARDGVGFREIEVHPVKIEKKSITLANPDLHGGEEIVISGARYLRIVFLKINNPHTGHVH
ncbi:MAG: hypothetical protein LBV07_00320 [Syntrophobacterales bacterium]|jgi:hypothetical protein|nr:hypothetical protein [Syntrophobacterales bacterium]